MHRYRLTLPWRSVTGVQHRTHQRVLRVEELVVVDAQVTALDHRGRPTRLPTQLASHPAPGRILVSLYDRAWRTRPIGEHLPHHGVAGPG